MLAGVSPLAMAARGGGGRPAWVPSGASLVLELARDRYWGAARDLISATRASGASMTDLAGVVTYVGDDAFRRVDRGSPVEGPLLNRVLRSADLSILPWANLVGGTASAPVITANAGLAPDGTMTATRIQFNKGAGTTTSDVVRRQQSYASSAVASATSVWVRSHDGVSSYRMTFSGPGSGDISVPVGPTWTRLVNTGVGAATPVLFLGLRGGLTPANSDTADVLVWGAQAENSPSATSYIPTGATTAARAGDIIEMPVGPWFNDAEGTLVAQIRDVDLAADRPSLSLGAGTSRMFELRRSLGVTASLSSTTVRPAGSALPTRTVHVGGYRRSPALLRAANGATFQDDTAATYGATPAYIRFGASPDGTQFLSGYIERVLYFPVLLSPEEMQAVCVLS